MKSTYVSELYLEAKNNSNAHLDERTGVNTDWECSNVSQPTLKFDPVWHGR